MELQERQQAMKDMAKTVNAGRAPRFGDYLLNPWAGENNPNRKGYFVESKKVTGRLNPGLWYRLTDKNGKFWEINGECAMFVQHLRGDEVFP